MFEIGLYKLDERAKLPTQATEGSAGSDVYTLEEVTIEPRAVVLARTGLALAQGLPRQLAEGIMTEIQVRPRSSLFQRYALLIPNSPGTIDSDYTGEILIQLYNVGETSVVIPAETRLAQLVVNFIPAVKWVESAYKVDKQARLGFGSTGA